MAATPSLVRVPTPFALSTCDGSQLFPVAEGRNVIGRSAASCSEIGFINLDSPRSAISRLHAVIDIAPNHDAWISDCRSTNGTVVAQSSGVGLLLDPERFYQLTPGAKVTIGDVELMFLRHSGFKEGHSPAAATSQPPAAIRARSKSAASRQASQSAAAVNAAADIEPPSDEDQPHIPVVSVVAAQCIADAASCFPASCPPAVDSADLKGGSVVAAIQMLQEPSRPSNGAASSSRPYLEDTPTELFVKETHLTRGTGKKLREEAPQGPLQGGSCERKAKSARHEAQPSTIQTPGEKLVDRRRLHVCLSGMDSAEKQAIASSVTSLGGRIVEDVVEASLLVVKHPPPRTPKFLIAVARGIPIVTPKYFAADAPPQFAPYVPDMSHGVRHYSSKDITRAILANSAKGAPALTGRAFNVQQMPAKLRATVADIIRGCGGTVSTKKKEGPDVTVLTEDAEDVYHSILSGVA